MTLEATLAVADQVATITLAGELDAENVTRFDDLIQAAVSAGLRRLVLNLEGLRDISSAGLRCLAVAHQRLGHEAPILLVGVGPSMARRLRDAGLDRGLTILAGDAPPAGDAT